VIIKKNEVEKRVPKRFELLIDIGFKPDKLEYQYQMMDRKLKLIQEYIQNIEKYNEENKIYSLNDNVVKFGNKNSISFATDITRKPRQQKVLINDLVVIDDIVRISQDLKSLIGEMAQLKPYLSNYLARPMKFNGKIIYQYFPNFIDKRYFFLVGVMYEVLYNYWDKIGDVLSEYYPPKEHSNNIYFTKVIDNIKHLSDNSSNYAWLKSFRDNNYKDLNKYRKQVVHYQNIESEFHDKYRSFFNDRVKLMKLQQEKIELFTKVVDQFKETTIGFEKAFLLIDEIN
jgi:hypothetical protein